MILPRSFYARDTVVVAKELLGCYLVHESVAGITAGRIVETEAYLGQTDEAAHAFKGERPRTKALFQEPGTLYVYFTYGMHYCANVVTKAPGIGEAVLFRSLEPVDGLELMKHRRHKIALRDLTNGPAKLVQALGVKISESGSLITSRPTYVMAPPATDHYPLFPSEIVTTTRVGITKATQQLLRFYIKNNQFVSRTV